MITRKWFIISTEIIPSEILFFEYPIWMKRVRHTTYVPTYVIQKFSCDNLTSSVHWVLIKNLNLAKLLGFLI